MNDMLMRNHGSAVRHFPSVDAAFTSADVENSVKHDAIACYG